VRLQPVPSGWESIVAGSISIPQSTEEHQRFLPAAFDFLGRCTDTKEDGFEDRCRARRGHLLLFDSIRE
jgi:hypothetical protein